MQTKVQSAFDIGLIPLQTEALTSALVPQSFTAVNGDVTNKISYVKCDSPDDMQVFLVGFTL